MAFTTRLIIGRYLGEIVWETEVWVADTPSHMIHLMVSVFGASINYGVVKSSVLKTTLSPPTCL